MAQGHAVKGLFPSTDQELTKLLFYRLRLGNPPASGAFSANCLSND
jgi:hypothetical protein